MPIMPFKFQNISTDLRICSIFRIFTSHSFTVVSMASWCSLWLYLKLQSQHHNPSINWAFRPRSRWAICPFCFGRVFGEPAKFRQRPVAASCCGDTNLSSRILLVIVKTSKKLSNDQSADLESLRSKVYAKLMWIELDLYSTKIQKDVSQEYSSFCWQTKHGGLAQGDWLTSCQAFGLAQLKHCIKVAGVQSIQS